MAMCQKLVVIIKDRLDLLNYQVHLSFYRIPWDNLWFHTCVSVAKYSKHSSRWLVVCFDALDGFVRLCTGKM